MEFGALRITQPSGRDVFAFSAYADDLLAVVSVPKLKRADDRKLLGYQRPEVLSHIAEIRRYLESADAVLANSIVVAFDPSVTFEPVLDTSTGEFGRLIVPVPAAGLVLPGFVVDGQQRLAAVSSCAHDRFPVFVTAMIAADEAEQRKQFVLVNRTKPLPQGLIFELLPEIEGLLPTSLARQQLAATLVTLLNLDPESSLFGLINTPTTPSGLIKDNSLRRLLTNSLTDGALLDIAYQIPDPATRNHAMVDLVSTFWAGVNAVFPEAASLPPTRSRLTHGVGISALGFVMDTMYLSRGSAEWTQQLVVELLDPLKSRCAWTSGEWSFSNGSRRWNDLQNIDRDIRSLTAYFRALFSEIKAA